MKKTKLLDYVFNPMNEEFDGSILDIKVREVVEEPPKVLPPLYKRKSLWLMLLVAVVAIALCIALPFLDRIFSSLFVGLGIGYLMVDISKWIIKKYE